MCPICKLSDQIIKRGFYIRASDKKKIQRYFCSNCSRSFSSQTSSFDFRLRKRRIDQITFRLLAKGVSQRGAAQILSVDPKTIARRVTRFGSCAREHIEKQRTKGLKIKEVVFDEMESFEHTKLKPLTIPLAVEGGSRRILAIEVGRIASKGLLAKISRKKYGPRWCQRKEKLNSLMLGLKGTVTEDCLIKSDDSKHYPKVVKKFFPYAEHITFKGRKPAVIGQGELKKGGFDPLFSLNQTAAMLRDNIKRLARKTWCTTKKVERLLDLLYIYAFYHNQRIDGVKRPRLINVANSI